MSFKLLGINGSLTPPPSRTRNVLDVALAGAKAYDGSIETQVLELRDFALEFCDGRSSENYNSDTRRALSLIEEADAYIVATSVYRGSYTGALKNFFDLVPNDPHGHDPLRGKIVGLIATGGSDHHYLVLEHQLRPLFSFFGAYTPLHGTTVSSFCSLSLKPPLILVGIDLNANIHDLILASEVFAVNILAEHAEKLSQQFARRVPDKFSNVSYRLGQLGTPLLDDALTTLECRVVTRYPGGDHSIFIGEVVSTSIQPYYQPLLYFRSKYGRLHNNVTNLVGNTTE